MIELIMRTDRTIEPGPDRPKRPLAGTWIVCGDGYPSHAMETGGRCCHAACCRIIVSLAGFDRARGASDVRHLQRLDCYQNPKP